MLEAAPQAGGRARGLDWQTAAGAVPIDNGQHLILGAYVETLALLREADALSRWESGPMAWTCASDSADHLLWQGIPSIGFPWRLIFSNLLAARPNGFRTWPLQWRLSMLGVILKGHRCDWSAKGTAREWFSENAPTMPRPLIENFWRPMVEGALNTEFESASAAVFFRILRDTLAGPSGSTDCWHPKQNLGNAAIEPLLTLASARGVRLKTGTRGLRINKHSIESSQGDIPFDHLVLALPARDCLRIWQQSKLPATAESERWTSVETRGIATLWLHQCRSRPPHLPSSRLNCSRGHLILNRPPGEWGQVHAVVHSAIHPTSDWESAEDAMRRSIPTPLSESTTETRLTHERHATWACTAETVDSGRAWGVPQTGVAQIWRAADDMAIGFPATIESAVIGGRLCAQAIQKSFSNAS
ncbi:MAG: hypothetical protein RLY67_400 [Pseudomonadota bacterium]